MSRSQADLNAPNVVPTMRRVELSRRVDVRTQHETNELPSTLPRKDPLRRPLHLTTKWLLGSYSAFRHHHHIMLTNVT